MSSLKNISYFLGASILSKPLGLLLTFGLAKFLGPTDFGAWVTLMLIISYSPIACLGTVETLVKQVPFYLGRQDKERVREVESSVLGSVVISAGVVMLAALLSPVVLPLFSVHLDLSLVVMMLIAAATSFISAFFYNRYAAYQNFKASGATDFMRSVLALLLVGGCAWIGGLRGAVAGYLLHEICMGLASSSFNIKLHGKVGLSFKKGALIHAIRVGFPITLLWWILTLSNTVDRVVLGSLLGPIAVGHYGLGISLNSLLGLVPMAVGRVLYPKVNMQIGSDSSTGSMSAIVVAPTFALGTLLANLQLFLLILTPLLYNKILPQYRPGLLAGQIFILGSFFGCLLRNGANYLIAANKERVFSKYVIATLVFNIISDVTLVKAGMGIAGVALGTSLAGLLLTSFVWRRVLLTLGYTSRAVWTTLLYLYAPIFTLSAAAVGSRLIYSQAFSVFNLPSVVIGLLIFGVLNAVLYFCPVYRNEMNKWTKSLLALRKTATAAPVLVRPVVQ